MKMYKTGAAVALCLMAAAAASLPAHAQTTAAPVKAHNVVLVHGAWADGSSWDKVIPILQAAGLHVTAVQNPLTSLAAADAETRRVLALQDGPTVLVGHSFAGTIISDTGDAANVSALVYVAARAPDAGEDFIALSKKFPSVPAHSGLVVHDGLSTLSENAFTQYFANGLPHAQAEVLFAEQQPTATSTFSARTTVAAGMTNRASMPWPSRI
jgi:pimeloyl-ACP methyl ester carboxylesterase